MEEVAARELRRDVRVDALIVALEAYDVGSAMHSSATAMWCRRIAGELGLTLRERTFAALCGLLHDVGKIATPAAILLKPGPLDVREWEIIRSHPSEGARMLETIPSLREVAPIVRWHHERPDGEGYPDRLEGRSIPLLARVVSVADAYHAMISQRVYRKPYSSSQALAVLRDGRDTQWDAAAVDAMIACASTLDARLASA
jgi:putative nucleotidyltransferase with HDIG domain